MNEDDKYVGEFLESLTEIDLIQEKMKKHRLYKDDPANLELEDLIEEAKKKMDPKDVDIL